MRKSHVWRGLANVFLAGMVGLGITASVANQWSGKVNELLGVDQGAFERSDDPEDYQYKSDFESGSDLIDAEIALNTRLSAEGSVVLKGTPALEGTKVTLFGMRSGEKMQFGGSMGSLIDESNIVTLADAMSENGFSINPEMVQFYKDMETNYTPERSAGGNVVSEEEGTAIHEVPVSEYDDSKLDGYKDAAVIVLGRDAGESACFYPGENGISDADEFSASRYGNILGLSDDEKDLISYVEDQGFGKVVVLLNSAVPMEVDELAEDGKVDSIMWIGNPGAYGTYGIAKLLSGEILPSGHLTNTYAVNSAKSPAVQNYGVYTFTNASEIDDTGNNGYRSDWYLVENESIYIGYKYYETRYFDTVLNQGNASESSGRDTADGGQTWDYDNEVDYSFGYGLEGSTFTEEITNTDIDWSGDKDSRVTVRVTNTGDQAAKHVVQVYLSQPYTDYDRTNGIEKAAVQLAGYAKTGESKEDTYADSVLLGPGETEDVVVTFNASDLISYDPTVSHDGAVGAYHLEAGDYYLATGNGAHDAVNAVLAEGYGQDLDYTGDVTALSVDQDQYVTESNGTTIQNRMTDSDLNSWDTDVTVTELTRNDWAGTFPQEVTNLTATEDMITQLQNKTYDQSQEDAAYDGETTFTQGESSDLQAYDLIGLSYDDEKYEEAIDQIPLSTLVNQYLCSLSTIREINMPMENRADSPLGFIGKIGQFTSGSIYEVSEDDPAYGHYTNVYTSDEVTAATFSKFLAEERGRLIGNDSLWTGYTEWFGPGLNIQRTPYNGRNIEYVSEDPILTGNTAAQVVKGAQAYGVVVNAKHFAFNDQETNRDGLAVFIGEQAGRENELTGFKIAFRDGGMNGVMTAFNRLGPVWIAADRDFMNGILRGEWGFQGYVVTDSVKSAQYFQPREAMMAGNDAMLGGSNNGEVWNFTEDTVKSDPVLWNGVRVAYHHKLYTLVNSNLMNGVTAETDTSGSVAFWVVMLQVCMGLCFVGFAVCLVMDFRKDRKERA